MALSGMTGGAADHRDLRAPLKELLQEQGSSQHPYQRLLKAEGCEGLNCALFDAVHHIAFIHGRLPGLLEEALRNSPPCAGHSSWLQTIAEGFFPRKASAGPIACPFPYHSSTADWHCGTNVI